MNEREANGKKMKKYEKKKRVEKIIKNNKKN